MTKHARAVIALVIASCIPALDWALERSGRLPIVLRDRPIAVGACVLVVVAVALVLTLRERPPRRRTLVVGGASVLATASALAFGWLVHRPYALPPSSPTTGVGQALPAITLPDESGRSVDLSQLRGTPTLLVWFRGSWCPYCRRQLLELAPVVKEYGDRARVVAITTEAPEQLNELRRELDLPFSILSDPQGVLMRRCELAHCVAIADAEGIVRWGVVSGNWDKLSPLSLLQATFEHR